MKTRAIIRLTVVLQALLWCLGAFAAVEDLPITEVDGKKFYYYEVQPRETIYGLSNKLGLTRDDILRYNPSIVDGLKAGQKLLFPVKDGVKAQSVSNRSARMHKVERGETLYGISNRYGLTVDELIELNPVVKDGLKTGQVINVSRPEKTEADNTKPDTPAQRSPIMPSQAFTRVDEATTPTPTPTPAPAETVNVPTILPPGTPKPEVKEMPEVVTAPAPQVIEDIVEEEPPVLTPPKQNLYPAKIAVLLPFELTTSQPSKQARRYLEFYKGMLMAVDTLSNPSAPIVMRTYDTTNGVEPILSQPGLQDVQVIIGPGSEEDLAILEPWADEKGITVLNAYVVKDEGYLDHPNVMQCNTPQKNLYEGTVRELLSRYGSYTPVFIKREGGPDERSEFVEMARSEFMQQGIMPKEITYTNKLTEVDLKGLDPMVSYIFIPYTAKQVELNQMLPALVTLHDQRTAMGDITLFGYPEWITFRGETLKNMHQLNTVVFSRFFNDTEDPESRDLEDRFYEFYGTQMERAIPRQAIFGYDMGRFAINALRTNGGDFRAATPLLDGVQNAYRVSHSGSRGLYNDALYFITYRPSGLIVKDFLHQ